MYTRRSTIESNRGNARAGELPQSIIGTTGRIGHAGNGGTRNLAGGYSRGLLSRREREVLELIVLGKTDRQIADELYISRITVSNHVVHILDKLDVPNRTAAAMLAVTNALGRMNTQFESTANNELS